LSYEPTVENIAAGTADDYMHKVYALGERTAPEGLIFKYINYIDEMPNEIIESKDYIYGMDFGFTNDPTTLVRISIQNNEIYGELLLYEPIDNPTILVNYLKQIGVQDDSYIIADSSDKYVSEHKGAIEMVMYMRTHGYPNVRKVRKTNSIMFHLLRMKEYKINIVKNKNFIKEFENYRYKIINGITINHPEDGYDHAIDALRYGFMTLSTQKAVFY
jgi:phage terminase large subunit